MHQAQRAVRLRRRHLDVRSSSPSSAPSQTRLSPSTDAPTPTQRPPTYMGPALGRGRPHLAPLGPHRPAHPAPHVLRGPHALVALDRRRLLLHARNPPVPDAPTRTARPVPLAARAQRLAAPPGARAASRRRGGPRRGGRAAASWSGQRVERVCGEESGRWWWWARGGVRRAGSARAAAGRRRRARVRRPVGKVPARVEPRPELERLAPRAADHGVVAPDPPH